MAKIKLGTSQLSVGNLLLKASHIVTEMTGNPAFLTPSPSLASVTAASTALTHAADEAANRDKAKIAIRNLRRSELKTLLDQLGSYVQTTSQGDEELILSSGFEVVRRGEPVGQLPPPGDFIARTGEAIGTIRLSWQAVNGAKSYVAERNDSDPMNEDLWKPEGYSTSSSLEVTGLQSVHAYWFRVRGIGAAGLGAQSDPARGIAA